MMNPISFVIAAGACLALAGVYSCGQKASSTSIITELATVDQTTSGNFTYQLFSMNSSGHESAYLGTLQKSGGALEWPSSMSAYFKALASGPQQIQYFIKAYSVTGPGTNGDVYYEVPVVGTSVVLNGPSTALWYAIRTSFDAQSTAVSLSQAGWQNLLFEIDTNCPTCLLQPGGNTFELIQTSGSLQSQLNSILASLGDASLSNAVLQTPPLGIAYSNPVLLEHAATLSASQGQTVQLQVMFFDPMDLSALLKPDSWGDQFITNGTETPLTPGTDLSEQTFFFQYNANPEQQETLLAHKTVRNQMTSAYFNYNVSQTPEAPAWCPSSPTLASCPIPSTIYFQANHETNGYLPGGAVFNPTNYAYDYRSEALTYSLISGPTGMTIDPTSNKLLWNPQQQDIGMGEIDQLGPAIAQVSATNTDGATSTQTFNLWVLQDNLPTITSATPLTWTYTEGVAHSYPFTTYDADGDPVEVTCIQNCDSSHFPSGTPAGAGWPGTTTYPGGYYLPSPLASSLPSPIALPYTPAPTQTFSVPFVPSYAQSNGGSGTSADSSVQIVLSIQYPSSMVSASPVPVLRQIPAATATVNMDIQNFADPPTFTSQPLAGSTPVLAAGSPLPSSSLSATTARDVDPASGPGAVPTPNPRPITYALEPGPAPSSVGPILTTTFAQNCSWIQINPTTGQVYATNVPFWSANLCKFNVLAQDVIINTNVAAPSPSVTVSSSSSPITLEVPEVALPFGSPTPLASPQTVFIEGKTGQALSLYSALSDPNLTIGPSNVPSPDPQEVITYTCVSGCGGTSPFPSPMPTGAAATNVPYLMQNTSTYANNGTLNWTPAYTIAPSPGVTPTFALTFQATKDGGSGACGANCSSTIGPFNVTVIHADAPFVPTPSSTSVTFTSANNSTYTPQNVVINFGNMAGDYSSYTWSVTCTVDGLPCGTGNAAWVSVSPTTGSGHGGTVTLTLSPVAADGYGGPSATSESHTILVSLTDTNTSNPGPSPTPSSATVVAQVNTVDGTNTLSASGCSSVDFTGSCSVSLSVSGPNVSNDGFTFQANGSTIGSGSTATWNYSPSSSCTYSEGASTTKSVTFSATSERTGGSSPANVTQTITINDASSCP